MIEPRSFQREHYNAMERLQNLKKGCVYVHPTVASCFGRHPIHDYARLVFRIKARGRNKSFDLPIHDKALNIIQRFNDIWLLNGAGLSVPNEAYWLDISFGQTLVGNPRIDYIFGALVFVTGGDARKQWGMATGFSSAIEESLTKGAKLFWSETIKSNQGEVLASGDLIFLPRHGSIAFYSGEILTFDGQYIRSMY